MRNSVVIVGAGLAGLAAARTLNLQGIPVQIFEASSNVGGRLQTVFQPNGVGGGFRLDRGFQVFFTGYRTAAELLDYKRLDLRAFEPGALIFDGRRLRSIHRNRPVATAFSSLIPFNDKLRLLRWTLTAEKLSQIDPTEDQSAEAFLKGFGFSEKTLNNFLRPFLGGIFLDRTLGFSAQQLNFVWSALSRGKTVIPASGIAAIPLQLAQLLPDGSIRLEAPVAEVGPHAIELVSGEVVEANAVIVATDAFQAKKLLPNAIPNEFVEDWRGSTTLYFEAYEAPVTERLIILNASGRGRVNEVVCLPWEYFGLSSGESDLISVTLLGTPSEEEIPNLHELIKEELSQWFPNVEGWKLLGAVAIPYAQMAQKPGFKGRLPSTSTQTPGIFLAGEITTNGSIDGAMESGVHAAKAVLEYLNKP